MIIECTDDASTSLDRKFSIFDLTGDGAFRLHVEQVFNANLAIDGTVNLGYVRFDIPLKQTLSVNDQNFGFEVTFHGAMDLYFLAFADLAIYLDTLSDQDLPIVFIL